MINTKFALCLLVRAAGLATLAIGSTAAISAVEPPPLPAGSAQVKIVTGHSPVEQQRMLRAHKHHHPGHHKKDMTHDDTMDDIQPAPKNPNRGNPNAR